jgi:hypothetical protein
MMPHLELQHRLTRESADNTLNVALVNEAFGEEAPQRADLMEKRWADWFEQRHTGRVIAPIEQIPIPLNGKPKATLNRRFQREHQQQSRQVSVPFVAE